MSNFFKFNQLIHKLSYLDPTKARDAFYTRENEIKQIESLIPEIREKIADTKDMKTETFKKLGDKRLMEEGIAAAFGSAEGGSLNGEGRFMLYISLQNIADLLSIIRPSILFLSLRCILGSSKAASTISSSLIKKRPALEPAPSDAKKPHIEQKSSESSSAENGNTTNGI